MSRFLPGPRRLGLGFTVFVTLGACSRVEPPGALREGVQVVSLQAEAGSGDAQARGTSEQLGTLDDNLPFEPSGEKVASIAWRTWIYTDTGAQRTRLGYLRAGAVLDARGPLMKNAGCEGGWLRINPRGFVCLGKGATQDLSHPVVLQSGVRPRLGEGFPYLYARSGEQAPYRYFRLPTTAQMVEIEGPSVLDRAANWVLQAKSSGLLDRLSISDAPPEYLVESGVQKPYGTKHHLRRQVHAGQASGDSGFAFVDTFLWNNRGFGVTTEMDIIALDRVDLTQDTTLEGIAFEQAESLPAAFHIRGRITAWKQAENGGFLPHAELVDKRSFRLTGKTAKGGMIETSEGLWLVQSSVLVVKPRDSFPSIATGRRKWIDISIKDQTLVAYEGQRAMYATLISAGRGGIGEKGESNPEGERTVRGTFMIYEKSISSTMDGDEDRADSYELQDVPFVQYFHRGFALHGAYWHNDFGRKRSHGCVNLAPRDAAWLFEWTDPPIPPGWHGALNKQRGTVVYVGY